MLTIKSAIAAVALAFAWTAGVNAAHESPWIFPSKAAPYSLDTPEGSLQALGMAGRAGYAGTAGRPGLGHSFSGSAWIFPSLPSQGAEGSPQFVGTSGQAELGNTNRSSAWIFPNLQSDGY